MTLLTEELPVPGGIGRGRLAIRVPGGARL